MLGDTRYSLTRTGPIIPTALSTTTTTPLRRYVRPAFETLLGPRCITVARCRGAGSRSPLHRRLGRVPAQWRVVGQSGWVRGQPPDLARCRPPHCRAPADELAGPDRHP